MRKRESGAARRSLAAASFALTCGLCSLSSAQVTVAAPIAAAHDGSAACATHLREIWALQLDARRSPAATLEALGVEHLWGTRNMRFVEVPGAAGAVLEVSFPKGSINPGNAQAPTGGAGFLYRGPVGRRDDTHACLSYEVMFPEQFEFGRGGKLPGLYGGAAPSGGANIREHPGFSLRYMWRSGGVGEIYAYVPNKKNPVYGESIGRGRFSFVRGRWLRLEQQIILNQPQMADGVLRVWEDGVQVIERQDIVYRTDAAVGISGLMFSTFFGGHDATWASPQDQSIRFRNIRLLAQDP